MDSSSSSITGHQGSSKQPSRQPDDPSTVTDNDLSTYVSAKIQEYEVDNEMDIGLWSLYQEDFESFDTDKFKRASTKQLKELYHLLRQRGVYAYPKEKRYTYAHLLASVVQKEEFHTWTQEEVDEVYIETNGDVKSNRLKIYTKHGVGYKPSNDPRVRSGTRPVQPAV